MTDPDWAALDAAWQPARAAGVLGNVTTEELLQHAAGYVPAACRVHDEFTGVDLGTGAGVPGVLLAALRPASSWTLVDANARRCEHAQAAVRALGMGDRVSVVHRRAEEIAHDPAHRGVCDLVVARSFGPASDLAECALPLIGPNGRLVVSATTSTIELWLAAGDRLGVDVEELPAVGHARYVSVSPGDGWREPDPRWPRRPAARRRSPIL